MPTGGTPLDAAEELKLELRKKAKILERVRHVYKKTLGEFASLFEDNEIVEIKRLPDDEKGRIWIRRLTTKGQIEERTTFSQTEIQAQTLVQNVAAAYGHSFDEDHAILRASMPIYDLRFTAFGSPLTTGIFWTVRRRIAIDIRLEDYLKQGQIEEVLYHRVVQAIKANKKIAVVGPQSVGKTVILTALLRKTAEIYPDTFFAVLEDVPEIRIDHPNKVYITTNEEKGYSAGALIPGLMRMGARSLTLGEITTNADAVIEAFTTGIRRTSGFTVHGENAVDAFLRLEQIHAKEGKPFAKTMGQKALDRIIVMDPDGPNGLPMVRSMWRVSSRSESAYNLEEV